MKIAFVAPFFGAQARGGAESECRQTAIHLAASGLDVHIFTTCLLDAHHNWNVNYYRQGTRREDGLTLHRFRVDYTDLGPFFQLDRRLAAGEELSPREQEQFICMNLNSPGLYRALAAGRDRFDGFCLIPYLFGTTFFAARILGRKAILIPCLHDEPYARMAIFAELFARVGKIVFHAVSERDLAKTLYGMPERKALLLGEGINTTFASDAGRFKQRYGIDAPFVLYAGKKDEAKNVDLLIRFFAEHMRRRGGDLKLVLLGPGRLPIPEDMRGRILDLGFVPEQDKHDAYAAADVFCQPSRHESFSIVLMEAWICRTPCLVHGGCAVTRDHVVQSGGGLYFENGAEFSACLDYLLAERAVVKRMGEAGRQYVLDNFAWDRIVQRYRREAFNLDD